MYNELMAKNEAKKKAQKDETTARDTMRLIDLILDDELRKVQGRSKEYDKAQPGSNTEKLLFPDGITPVVNMPIEKEPDAAHEIALKIISLGSGHELYPLAAEIEAAIENCRKISDQRISALKTLGDAQTAVEIAKIAIVRQYNSNYYVAASDMDKNYAERLFPVLRSPKKKDDGEENNTTTETNP
jgi:hypothetical protein